MRRSHVLIVAIVVGGSALALLLNHVRVRFSGEIAFLGTVARTARNEMRAYFDTPPASSDLHRRVRNGDYEGVRQLLTTTRHSEAPDVNAYDLGGDTALMHAVTSSKAGVEMVRLLLEHGADVHQVSRRFITPD